MVTAYLGLLEKKYGDKLDDDAKKYMDFAVEEGGAELGPYPGHARVLKGRF